MGDDDPEVTRLQRVFDALLDRREEAPAWMAELWDTAARTRPEAGIPPPADMGA